MSVFIHELADVQTENIGNRTKIWQFVVILPGAKIGENCNICSHCFIENDVVIGDNVTIKNGVQVWDGIVIENNVFIGPNVTFTNDKYPRSKQYPDVFEKTIIEEGASIGANSTILCGITIGKFALIGAGSIITKNVPAHSLWFGNPARFKGFVCKCGHRLESKSKVNILLCPLCGRRFVRKNEHEIEEINNGN